MSIGNWLSTGLSGALLLAAASASANASREAQCVFERYVPLVAAPYHADVNVGYGTHSMLQGAQVFVPAQEGLTAEWLSLSVQRSLAQRAAKPGAASACLPTVAEVKVSVASAGHGFWVRLTGTDQATAKQLLSWARTMAPPAQ